MMLSRKPGLFAVWACCAFALGCGTKGDSGGSGTDRTGPSAGPAPSTGNGSMSPSMSGGAAGSGTGFDNGPGMVANPPRMMTDMTGVNETTSPDDVKCGGARFTPEIKKTIIPGNILIVADKSGSMLDDFPATGTEKGQEARKAISTAIASLVDTVNVGTVFFPDAMGCSGGDCSCNVPPFSSAPPQIPFTAGTLFVPKWDAAYFPVNNGNTPLSEGLQAADKALTDNLPSLTGTTIVVVVTDGAPNCVLEDMSVEDKIATLIPLPMRWLGMGVKTYVLGLPGNARGGGGILDAEAEQILNAVAAAGGTEKFIPASDPMIVQAEFAKIIGESVTSNFETCTIPLEKQPPNLDDVNLVVTMNGMDLAVDRDLGDAGGWALDANAENIVLQGRFCDLARMGEYQNITVVFGCVDVPPLPKPPPPM